MGRSGVAATIVAVILFTSMLLANAAVYAAQGTVLRSTIVSSAQLSEQSLASLSSGLGSYGSLASLQARLEAAPMDCRTTEPYLDSLVGNLSYSGNDDGVAYASKSGWAYTSSSSGAEGAPLLPGFSGFSASGIDIRVQTQVREAFVGGLPTYSGDATDVVHLAVPVERMVSECLSALSSAAGALSGLTSCTQSAVGAVLSAVGSEYPGSTVTGSATVAGDECSVQYSVTITQGGIEGVSGTFAWSVFGSGSASLSVSPLSGPPGA